MERVLNYLWLQAPLLLAIEENLDDGNDVWEGWGSVIFVTGIVVARSDEAREAALQQLAEQSAASQQILAEQQRQPATELAAVRGSVRRIEQILREVE